MSAIPEMGSANNRHPPSSIQWGFVGVARFSVADWKRGSGEAKAPYPCAPRLPVLLVLQISFWEYWIERHLI